MSNKKIKPVSFNVTKEDDKRMLKHVARKNFSGYVKKLILQDMENGQIEETPVAKNHENKQIHSQEQPKENAAKRMERMRRKMDINQQENLRPNLFHNQQSRRQ